MFVHVSSTKSAINLLMFVAGLLLATVLPSPGKADELDFAYRDACRLERFGAARIGPGVIFDPPVIIRKGGTYTGNWRSDDPTRPTVLVETAERVIIERSIVVGRGHLIVGRNHSDLIVRHSLGFGLDPGVQGKARGRFVWLQKSSNALLYDNYLEHLWGIRFDGFAPKSGAGGTIRVLGNRACNIIGAASDGMGGLMPGDSGSHFVQLANARRVAAGEIAWNVVVNQPFKSRVSDVVNLFNSGGTEDNPFEINNNFIDGAYPDDPTSDKYSGGGILLGDGGYPPATPETVSSHVRAYENSVISTSNYGIGIAAGNNNSAFSNRILSTGYLPDGRYIASQNVGLFVWNIRKDPKNFFNNKVHDNDVNWVRRDPAGHLVRVDSWTPDCTKDEAGQSLCRNNSRKVPVFCEPEGCAAEELLIWERRFRLWQARQTP